jgi:hypothetical protein
MKNSSQFRFTMSSKPVRACERCVYGSGEHAKWCPLKGAKVAVAKPTQKRPRLPARYAR